MALNEEDLKFRITIDPDTAKMEAAVKDLGKNFDALGKAGTAQLEAIQAHAKFANMSQEYGAAERALQKNLQVLKEMTRELIKQKTAWRELSEAGREQLDSIQAHAKFGNMRGDFGAEDRAQAAELERIRRESFVKEGFKNLGNIGRKQYEKIQAHNKFTEAFKPPDPPSVIELPKRDVFGALQKGVGPAIAEGLNVLGDHLGPVGKVLVGIGAVAVTAYKALQKLSDGIAGLVGVASPAAFRQWELAVRDLKGVIGQTLIPVLSLFRDAVRLLGDVFANILPNAREMEDALAPLAQSFREFGNEVRKILAIIGPLIREGLITILYQATTELSLFIGQLEILIKVLRYGTALALFGNSPRSSVGAAARPGRISTGEEYQRLNIESALNSFGGQSIPQKQLATLEQIRDILNRRQRSTVNQPALKDPHGINRALLGF